MRSLTSDLGLAVHQIGYQNRLFWRTPIAALFTVAFPLMFLVLFNVLFDGGIDVSGGRTLTVVQFYAPSLAVFTVASATYTNLGIRTSIARDEGVLKRFRGTPLPPWAYLAGRVGSAVWVALIGVVVMLGVAAVFFDLDIRTDTLLAAALAFGVGAATFAALGLALAALTPTAEAAPAIANFTILPLAFISDVFLSLADPPAWLDTLGDVFPLKPFVAAFQAPFVPSTEPPGFRWGSIGVMALWGVAGIVVAVRFFGWEPREPRVGRRGRRRS
jgi:ABC-2 type transport system permease protein